MPIISSLVSTANDDGWCSSFILHLTFILIALALSAAAGFALGVQRRKRASRKLKRANAALHKDVAEMRRALEEEIKWRLAAERVGAQSDKPNAKDKNNVIQWAAFQGGGAPLNRGGFI